MNRQWILTKSESIFFITLLLIASAISSVAISTESTIATKPQNPSTSSPSGNDWWPMFRHDIIHSGYSTITAPEENQVLWSYQMNDITSSSPAVSHGRVYVGSWDWNIYCFYMDTGDLLWTYSTNGPITSSPAVVNGKVYVGSQDTRLYCLNAVTGSFLWEFQTDFLIETSPVVVDDMVFFGSSDGSLYCLNEEDGSLLWSYQTGSVIVSSPAVNDGEVYFGATNGDFLCLDSSTGDLLWKNTMTDGTYSSPAIDEGKIFFGSNDRNVYCLNASDGGLLWNYSASSEVHSSPAIAYDNLYVGTSDGRLFCLEKETGDFVWSYQISGSVNSAPSVADNKVYFGTDPCCGYLSYFICLDALTGMKIWEYNFNTQFGMKSSPALAAGKVFASAGDGVVYAFGDIEFLADANGPYYGTVNVPVQFTGSVYGGQPGFSWLWEFGDGTTSTDQNPIHTYAVLGDYQITLTVTDNDGNVVTDDTRVVIELPNAPPEKPVIDGPTSGKTGESYDYSFVSSDINGDTIRYFVDWGDNTSSGWIGPFQPGVLAHQEHIWSERGSYTVTAKAKDSHGAESIWSNPLIVMIAAPELTMELKGGFGITLTVINSGDIAATNISWNVSFMNGFVLPMYTQGIVPIITAGGQVAIHVAVFGLGKKTIITSMAYNQETWKKTAAGVVLLFFVLGVH